MTVNEGDTLPDFSLTLDDGSKISNESLKGQWSVLFFYPKDSTPGCTKEAIAFSEAEEEFSRLGARIIGISRGTIASKQRFREKNKLTVALGADETGKVTEAFGVWVEKKNYGRTYMGIERTTFIVDPDGIVRAVWRKVRVKDHAQKVLEKLHELVDSNGQ